jgi:hypothetical protein
MTMKTSVALSAAAFALLVAAAACVGNDFNPGATGDGTDGGGTGNGGGDGGGAGGDSATPTCKGDTVEACGASCTACTPPTSGTVACTAGACVQSCTVATAKVCGTACVDTTTSSASCGSCGHSCEAGQCLGGACQPFPVATGFAAVHAIDISSSGLVISADADLKMCSDPGGCTAATLKTVGTGFSSLGDAAVAGTDVYFQTGQGDFSIIQHCPVTGCPAGGPVVIETKANDLIGRIVAGPNNVAWSRTQSFYGPYIHSCTLPACGTVLDLRPIPPDPAGNPAHETTIPIVTMAAGPTKLLYATSIYNDGVTHLRSCGLDATCPTPTAVDTAGSPVVALTQQGGLFYGSSGNGSGGQVIWSAPDAGTTTRTPLVADAAGVTDIAVDASGIYWINGTTGKVQVCKTLTGCPGGGDLLATGQTGATRIRVDAKFVYWMTPTSVMKLAK